MADNQSESSARESGRQYIDQGMAFHVSSSFLGKFTHPQPTVRRSALAEQMSLYHEHLISKGKSAEQEYQFPSPSMSNTPSEESRSSRSLALESSTAHQKQKRRRESSSEESEHRIPQDEPVVREKRQKTSLTDPPSKASQNSSNDNPLPVSHWIQKRSWPSECFGQDNTLGGRRSSPSFHGNQSETSQGIFRKGKDPAAKNVLFEKTLANFGIYMDDDEEAVAAACERMCNKLLVSEQSISQDSLFRDDLFKLTCRRVRRRNEDVVLRDITPLLVPPVEILFSCGAKHLKHLTEELNVSWSRSFPMIAGSLPQPDYAVGFKSAAFTNNQLRKLEASLGDWEGTYFRATKRMYFPFLTCEVKCGNDALNIADRYNAHSASVAVKGVVELYRLASREDELHEKILAFSISHDHEAVKIYGHYALIDGSRTSFYRHPIHKFDFTALDGKERWTASRFTRNLYDTFAPVHLERIRAAIDQLPGLEFLQRSQQSKPEFKSRPDQGNSQPNLLVFQDLALSAHSPSKMSESSVKERRSERSRTILLDS